MTRLTKRYDKFLLTGVLAVGAILPLTAEAYVGPGAGLSLLTALWGIIAAVGMALFFVIMWPIRRMRRRRKAEAAAAAASAGDSSTAQARIAQDPESPPSTTRVEHAQRETPQTDQRS
ncbi:MAG: hypothetical protein HRU39_16840 [Salinicola sp.]|uniref:hypothetical protein n=1 Tax=Salinicola sp. TaxID=1978524 RepID=UPI001D325702|nr:hypothetical protein [Salinicola sp.]NRB57623.1 hypothetical protein [Salinicola sp.]